ncbi:MAG: endopeptidase La [Candidatus Berkelbacteria bacterium]|nr:endopeptidase La [Candidatus Berkelbacteria bacterium]
MKKNFWDKYDKYSEVEDEKADRRAQKKRKKMPVSGKNVFEILKQKKKGQMMILKRDIYPLIPLRDTVIFPYQIIPLVVARPRSSKALEEAVSSDRQVIFVAQKEKNIDEPDSSNLFTIGCLSQVQQMSKRPDGAIQVLAEGLARVRILDYTQHDPYFKVKVQEVVEDPTIDFETESLMKAVLTQFRQSIEIGKIALPLETMMTLFNIKDPNRLADLCIFNLDLEVRKRQEILETVNAKDRLKKVSTILSRELKILQLGKKIQTEAEKELGKMQKEILLREQLKAIQKELGIDDDGEFGELAKKIEAAKMPEETKSKALKEFDRLKKMPPYSPEISYIRTYLDWLVDLPWSKESGLKEDKIDIKKAQKILDEDHYGLKKVKERIVEYLAVHKLAGKAKGSILCFVGPPGTGKTSIGQSIARSMGRKFIRMSLGGIRDEAEIRGHRRTYVGALPGRIVQGIKNANAKDPVFMLDEIDKVGADFRGDPSAALLEALDPEQNNAFSDHYLEVPFDLSRVMFITTANMIDTIPPALLDRMEVIAFPGYTEDEKFHIAKKYLTPKQIKLHGLKDSQIHFEDSALKVIVREYTKEAGVRELERQIASVCRKIAKKIAEGSKKKYKIIASNIHTFLGAAKYQLAVAEKKDEVGLATGLAVTEAGGEVLFIESSLMPGKGRLLLTGHLGDVMKESAQAAVSYARSIAHNLVAEKNFYEKNDIHVHVPAGAIPKDGPSAGIAMATSVVSALAKIPTKRDIGMTGEITLRGRVLEIGGVKEKVLAAHRAGLKEVILPKGNKKDLEDIPANVKKELKFHFVENMKQVLPIALKLLKSKKWTL